MAKNMDDIRKMRERAKQASSIKEYIEAYKELWKSTIDASPFGLERTTEERMIRELEGVAKKEKAFEKKKV